MLFPSIPFLFYFLPLFFIIYCVMPGMTAKNCLLLVIGDSFTREFWQDYFSLHAS